ncbi:Uncharacterised protein [Vibrio cholerae]|nr:Uncharacterised protein [Vibrio cholerae]
MTNFKLCGSEVFVTILALVIASHSLIIAEHCVVEPRYFTSERLIKPFHRKDSLRR